MDPRGLRARFEGLDVQRLLVGQIVVAQHVGAVGALLALEVLDLAEKLLDLVLLARSVEFALNGPRPVFGDERDLLVLLAAAVDIQSPDVGNEKVVGHELRQFVLVCQARI